MLVRPIVVTTSDEQRLRDLIQRMRDSRPLEPQQEEAINRLEEELARAKIVHPDQIPADVVTMNTVVLVRAEHSRRTSEWTVVYPEDADFDEGRISVFDPLGTALLGYHTGDEFEWEMPVGLLRYRVEQVIRQPEASGDYDR